MWAYLHTDPLRRTNEHDVERCRGDVVDSQPAACVNNRIDSYTKYEKESTEVIVNKYSIEMHSINRSPLDPFHAFPVTLSRSGPIRRYLKIVSAYPVYVDQIIFNLVRC